MIITRKGHSIPVVCPCPKAWGREHQSSPLRELRIVVVNQTSIVDLYLAIVLHPLPSPITQVFREKHFMKITRSPLSARHQSQSPRNIPSTLGTPSKHQSPLLTQYRPPSISAFLQSQQSTSKLPLISTPPTPDPAPNDQVQAATSQPYLTHPQNISTKGSIKPRIPHF